MKSHNHVGLVFSERLINMPVQTVPPMYRMLDNEIKWAIDDVRYVSASFLTEWLI
jgi:protein BCP1